MGATSNVNSMCYTPKIDTDTLMEDEELAKKCSKILLPWCYGRIFLGFQQFLPQPYLNY